MPRVKPFGKGVRPQAPTGRPKPVAATFVSSESEPVEGELASFGADTGLAFVAPAVTTASEEWADEPDGLDQGEPSPPVPMLPSEKQVRRRQQPKVVSPPSTTLAELPGPKLDLLDLRAALMGVTVRDFDEERQSRLLPMCIGAVLALAPIEAARAREDLKRLLRAACWVDLKAGPVLAQTFLEQVLDDEIIEDITASRLLEDYDEAGRATFRSVLRRVAKANAPGLGPTRVSYPRQRALAPHTAAERARHYRVAAAKTVAEERDEGLTLLDLVYAAGLRPGEAVHCRGSWITGPASEVTMVLPDDTGRPRQIPILGEAAGRLHARALRVGLDGYMLRPASAHRRNVSELVRGRLIEGGRVRLDLRAARNSWLVDLLNLPVPFSAIAQMAGLVTDARTCGDLLPYLARPTAASVRGLLLRR